MRFLVYCLILCHLTLFATVVNSEEPEESSGAAIHGAKETAAIEKVLRGLDPIANMSIPPRDEILRGAIAKQRIPVEYIDEVTSGMLKIVRPPLLPKDIDNLDWYGLPGFKYGWNYLYAQYDLPSQDTQVHVFGHARHLFITIKSSSLFPDPVAAVADSVVMEYANRVLNFPADKVSKINVEHHTSSAAGVPVIYGRMRCEYDERTSPISEMKWWSFIGYTYMDGKVTLSVSILDSSQLPASTSDPWHFQ